MTVPGTERPVHLPSAWGTARRPCGSPAAISSQETKNAIGIARNTWTLDILHDQILTIRSLVNPDKLAHVGPVTDAWTVLRETTQAHRTTH